MSIENIIFEDTDTPQETAVKVCLLHAGSTELGKELKKLGVTHTKTNRGAKIGRLEVTL